MSHSMGGHKPTNNARLSAFPRSSWSTVFARIQSPMHNPMEPSDAACMCHSRNPARCILCSSMSDLYPFRRVPRSASPPSVTARALLAAARWPFGLGLTAWRYMWRTTPMRRRELVTGAQAPPRVPRHLCADAQLHDDGVGPLYHRHYAAAISDSKLSPADVMARIQLDPNLATPTEFARFDKLHGAEEDEYLVRMPGPWNGPVRVIDATALSFRFVTLRGHLEAGQIEFSAAEDDELLVFEIQSWARSGDLVAAVLYDTLRMAKEVQLHMWTSFLEKVVAMSGGIRRGPISIETSVVETGG
jgi:hypothetical protein